MNIKKTKLNRFFCWAFLAIFRTLLVIACYLLEAIMTLSEFLLKCFALVGKPLGVKIKFLEDENPGFEEINFTEKYTKDDIDQLAQKISPDATIKDIEGELGLSYRQARKVKEAAKSPLQIQHYRWTA